MNKTHFTLLPVHFHIPIPQQNILFADGKNIASRNDCQIKAKNDLQAVECWLHEYVRTETTYRSYKKEAQRLLLWCALNIKKPLSDLTRDDFEKYSEFLRNPQPTSLWCGKKTKKKEKWKPFVKGLSQSARATAMTIINSLMQYLVDAEYLQRNPLKLLRKKIIKFPEQYQRINTLKRKFEPDEIAAFLQIIEWLPENTDK